jgi:hypothetical protein
VGNTTEGIIRRVVTGGGGEEEEEKYNEAWIFVVILFQYHWLTVFVEIYPNLYRVKVDERQKPYCKRSLFCC